MGEDGGEDRREVLDHYRRRCESLVSQQFNLSCVYHGAGSVRVRWEERRRIKSLCRPGKAGAAGILGADRVRDRLGRAAAAAKRAVLSLYAFGSMALRSRLHGNLPCYVARSSDGIGAHGGQAG